MWSFFRRCSSIGARSHVCSSQMRNTRTTPIGSASMLSTVLAGILAACGSPASSTGGSSSNDGGGGGGSGEGSSSGDGGGADSAARVDGSAEDAAADAPKDASSACACDPATQYCLRADVTTSGQHDVARCEARIGDCADCSCYSQLGLCLEEGLPRACTVISGLIVVACSEIP